jgi:hypothetical protein
MAYRDAVLALPDLIAFYEFDETSGTVAADSEGSADLTIAGDVTLGVDPLAGGVTKAASFSRAGLGRANRGASFPTSNVSFAFWFKIGDLATMNQCLFFNGQSSATNGYGLYMNGARVDFQDMRYLFAGIDWYTMAFYAPGSEVHHHMVFTVSGTDPVQITVFVDGVQVYSESKGAPITASGGFTIGADDAAGTNAFTGTIDDFAVIGSVLDLATAQALFDAGEELPSPPLDVPWTTEESEERRDVWEVEIFDRHPSGPRPYTVRYKEDGVTLNPAPNSEEHYDPGNCFRNAYHYCLKYGLTTTGWSSVMDAARAMWQSWVDLADGSVQLVHHHTHGFALDWLINGNETSRDLLFLMQPIPSAYAEDHWRRIVTTVGYQREIAFQLMGNIDRYLCGGGLHELTLVNLEIQLDQLDHLCRSPEERWGVYIRPFMMGLGMRSLVYFWFTFRDSVDPDIVALRDQIPGAIANVLAKIMSDGWWPRGQLVNIAGAGDLWEHGCVKYTWPATDTYEDIVGTVQSVISGKVFTGPGTLSTVDDYYKNAVILRTLGGGNYVLSYVGATRQFTMADNVAFEVGDEFTIAAQGDEGGNTGGGHVLNALVSPGASFLYWYHKFVMGDAATAAPYRNMHQMLFNGQRMAWLYAYTQKEYNEGMIWGPLGLGYLDAGDAGVDTQFESLMVGDMIPPDEPTLSLSAPIPATGVQGQASGDFTVSISGAGGLTVRIVPQVASGVSGVIVPTFIDLTQGTPSGTFVFIPSGPGHSSIRVINNSGLDEPPPVAYLATVATPPPLAPPDDSPRPGIAIPAATSSGGRPSWIIPY